jgi:hypothetical protein
MEKSAFTCDAYEMREQTIRLAHFPCLEGFLRTMYIFRKVFFRPVRPLGEQTRDRWKEKKTD